MSFRLITILILLIFSSNCTTPKVKSDNATRSLSSAQNQFYQNIRKVVEEKINTSFFVKESVSNQIDFEFDLEMQTPLFKKNITEILIEGFSNLYKISPNLSEQLVENFLNLEQTTFLIEPFFKNQKIIPRELGGTGPLWTYEGGEPDLSFIMKANKNKNVGLIIFNYFHFFFDNKSSGWKNRGYPSLFFSDSIHPYNRATIFHEWLHVLGVTEGKSHNNLTFQQMASDPVYSCTNLAFPDNRTPSFKDFSLKDNKNYSITPASCLNCLTKAISTVIPQEESIQFCNTYRN